MRWYGRGMRGSLPLFLAIAAHSRFLDLDGDSGVLTGSHLRGKRQPGSAQRDQPDTKNEVPTSTSTRSTCRLLGICVLCTAFFPCMLCLPDVMQSIVINLGSIVATVSLGYVFFGDILQAGTRLEDWKAAQDKSVWATWMRGGELGGWCAFLIFIAIVQLLQCCCWMSSCVLYGRPWQKSRKSST